MMWISLISFVSNAWTPFMFHINTNEENKQYCDINRNLKHEYFAFNSIYMLLVFLAPSILISVCNAVIIRKTFQHDQQRKKLFESSSKIDLTEQIELNDLRKNKVIRKKGFRLTDYYSIESSNRKLRIKPYYWTNDQLKFKNKPKKTNRKLN